MLSFDSQIPPSFSTTRCLQKDGGCRQAAADPRYRQHSDSYHNPETPTCRWMGDVVERLQIPATGPLVVQYLQPESSICRCASIDTLPFSTLVHACQNPCKKCHMRSAPLLAL